MCRLIVALTVLFLFGPTATAEQACVPYHHQCLPLDLFKCDTITRNTAIHRVCYAEQKQYMVLWFKRKDGGFSEPYYFCALGSEVFKEFMAADSMRRFYNEHIGGRRKKHGPFDCRDHPIPTL